MESLDLATLWMGMLDELKPLLAAPIYMNWFESSLIPVSYEHDELVLATPQKFILTFINKNYASMLNEVAEKVTGHATSVRLIMMDDMTAAPPAVSAPKAPSQPAPPPHTQDGDFYETITADEISATKQQTKQQEWIQEELTALDDPTAATTLPLQVKPAASITPPPVDIYQKTNLNPNYTFENFIVGNSNRVPYTFATTVADAPAQKYNPLYIYGDSGLGKTHLMHAIGNRILQKFPNMRLRCITSEDFVNDFIQSIQDKSTENFRQQYRNIDILLVDDIQFLGFGEKDSSKEEFFHTFNKLYQGQKQMIFTSDRAPQDINKLEDRLRSRFQSGMVTWIDPPDLETRIAILRTWAQKQGVDIESAAISYIASNGNENIRELYGAFNNVLSLAAVEQAAKIKEEHAKRALQYLVKAEEEKKYVTIDEITKAVCSFYNVNYKELMGKKKTKDIAFPRQIAMYLCRELTGNTYPHIGTAFNGRDHTTVMHACMKVMKLIEKDARFKESIEALQNKIKGVDK